MTWSTELPTVPGWYWHRIAIDDIVTIREVASCQGQLMAMFHGNVENLPHIGGEWCGPLEPPADA